MDDRRPLKPNAPGPNGMLVPNNGRLLHNSSSPHDSPILNNPYSSNVPSVSAAPGGVGLSTLQAPNMNAQGQYQYDRSDQFSGRSRGSPHLLQRERSYIDPRHHLRFRHQQKVQPQPTATTVTGACTRSLTGAIMAVGGGAGGSGSRSKSAVVGRVSAGVNVRELTSSCGAGGGSGASGGVRGQIGIGPGNGEALNSNLPLEGLRRHGASVSSLPAVLSGPKFNQKPIHLPSKSRKYMAKGSMPKSVFLSNLVDVRTCNKFANNKTCGKNLLTGSNSTLKRPLIANSTDSSPSDDAQLPSPTPSSPRSPARDNDSQQQPIHTIALWPNIPQVPNKDPALEDTMTGSGCCVNCCTKIRTASCGSLILLPVHLLLLLVLVGYLALGAFIFSRLEGSALEIPTEGTRPSTIRLPGTPKSKGMVEANHEMVERILNTSMEMVMERSVDAVFQAVYHSQNLQNAMSIYKSYKRSDDLPSDDRLDLLSDEVIFEWKLRLYNLTSRYYAIVTRHAYGYEIGNKERAAVWNSEEPPSTTSWTMWSSLLHAFCLITTMGGSIHATSSGGRATTVIYTLIGVVLYMVVVALWAARLTTLVALIVKIFYRKKVDSSTNGKMMPGNYEETPIHNQRLSQLHQSPAGLTIVNLILITYILSAGVQVVGGSDYAIGLKNVILVLATVRPPNPLPEGSSNIMGFIGFVTVGHILIALLVSIAVTLSGRWWTSAGTTS